MSLRVLYTEASPGPPPATCLLGTRFWQPRCVACAVPGVPPHATSSPPALPGRGLSLGGGENTLREQTARAEVSPGSSSLCSARVQKRGCAPESPCPPDLLAPRVSVCARQACCCPRERRRGVRGLPVSAFGCPVAAAHPATPVCLKVVNARSRAACAARSPRAACGSQGRPEPAEGGFPASPALGARQTGARGFFGPGPVPSRP